MAALMASVRAQDTPERLTCAGGGNWFPGRSQYGKNAAAVARESASGSPQEQAVLYRGISKNLAAASMWRLLFSIGQLDEDID
tara:strand:+ start:14648 stop:14896 length:249 start_codon:yes stop_codon:yes gene_type:complete